MKNKKVLKWICISVSVVAVGIALYFYLGFFGNPVSKVLAKVSSQKYINENYPDCYIDRVGYNFKDGRYFANIKKEDSPDTNFFVYTDWLGNIGYDAYESYVVSGHNTLSRMMMEYRQLLDEAIPQESVDYTLDIYYGDILSTGNYERYITDNKEFEIIGMPEEEIILDKEYDYTDISYKYGYVCLYVTDEDVSIDRACEILLDVKQRLNNADIGFYYMDFVLHKPRQENGMPNEDETRINIDYFKWDDIYEEGLAERVQSAHDRLTAYYEQEDAKRRESTKIQK